MPHIGDIIVKIWSKAEYLAYSSVTSKNTQYSREDMFILVTP